MAVTYYDHETDGHRTLNSITDGEGRAVVELDGCVGTYLINNPRMFNGAILDLAEKPYIPQKILLQ